MHLQLQKVLSKEFSGKELKDHEERLLAWCRGYKEKGWPAETPAYILAFYARHLKEEGKKKIFMP